METTDYVSYELAKKLKECGFDEPCDHYYCAFDNETDVRFWSIHPAQSQNGFTNPNGRVIADAPTLWQSQKWLREKKGIAINVIAHDGGKYSHEHVYLPNYDESTTQWGIWHINHTPLFDTYEDALSAGIAEILRLLVGKESEQS